MLTTIKGNFSTNLSAKDINLKLNDVTTDKKISALNRNDVAFIGSIGSNSFSLTKYKFFNNDSLNPIVRGEYTSDGQETKITYVCSLRKSDRIASWIAGMIYVVLIIIFIVMGIFNSPESFYVPIGIIIFAIFEFAVTGLIYIANTRKAVRELKKVLQSK
ncbi:MAG: hypothetical protein E7384_04810 [Ruminococcaceae bacterium]|nr:hypothetical protein [Oscillospiraceae bacterium]